MSLSGRVIADEDGFSITELLMAMIIGSIVLFALMTLMTTGFTKSLEVTDRADAAQTGRTALNRMVTDFDSSICLDPVNGGDSIPPLLGTVTGSNPQVGSDGNYAGFYADLSGVSDQPDKYTLTYSPTAKTITESRYDASGSLPNITIPATPTKSTVLAQNVVPARDSNGAQLPIFRYFEFETDGSIDSTSPLATPVAQADADDAVRVLIAFKVIPGRTNREDSRASQIEGQSELGTPDPNAPNAGACP